MNQKKNYKKGQTENKYFKFLKEDINFVLFILLLAGFIIYRSVESICLNTYAKKTEASIVNEKNYGYGHISHKFSYSYMFKVNNEKYYGDSQDPDFSLGETVMIEYVPFYPDFNQICEDELPSNPR